MPIHNPCALLNRLLEEPSASAWLEFNLNNKDPREICEFVSALANSAMLAGQDRGPYRNGSGTELRRQQLKHGNDDFTKMVWEWRRTSNPLAGPDAALATIDRDRQDDDHALDHLLNTCR